MMKRVKGLQTLALALCLAACGGGGGGGNGSGNGGGTSTPAPVIDSFNASAAVVNSGATVTLSWSVSNASKVLLQPGTIELIEDRTGKGHITRTTSTEDRVALHLYLEDQNVQ